ncbi:indole-3-glycerol phosphate synthase TrpC [Ilumatobacter coccineus]|uniref:Indole-3-glycerol phosphate synthase n=1 Tax=Ilumatobacter coccineus (strain NBRC 103263 / KCTC 29153 / YM16-304) TaxID=1313172 RepID=A0A6C7E8F0_ILUCY|nr:indole-3-glycerol phosphate synthase TrpC [Ilumatobacter coccineus]BAN02741.1 indole-3-glycerol phosphate synthase [Ilumatobacter coccineus YM16-304]
MAATYLDKILDRHRSMAAVDTRSLDALLDEAHQLPPTRGFADALRGSDALGVISEIKRRSPSKGDLNVGLDPAELAATYEAGGASCLSVLTDVEGFGGSVADLQTARAACSLPVLRKDFTVSELDVIDARLMGADCVLLIAAALDTAELTSFHRLATEIGLDVLVEIHDEAELEHALDADATLIGVNQRDLVTFQVDHERAVRMAGVIPDHAVKIAESGVRHAADARMLETAGYDAVLVGETLVTSGDPAAAIRELIG